MASSVAATQNVVVIEGDSAGHEVLQEPQVQREIRETFGDSVIDENGNVDRAVLGRRVFGAGHRQQQARRDLEEIVHPRIRRKLIDQIGSAQRGVEIEAVLLDAAVLFEAGWDDLCDAVVFFDAPYELRKRRVQQSRGWSESTLKAREASQRSLAWKRQAADYIVDNSGTLSDAAAQLADVIRQVTFKLRDNENAKNSRPDRAT